MTTAVEFKERPILFSGPMVKAILEGRKTQTRRVIKPQPQNRGVLNTVWGFGVRNSDPDNFSAHIRKPDGEDVWVRCPYGRPGDRLWVRETWGRYYPFEPVKLAYRADNPEEHPKWKPSIHMPRWASRITLEITNIKVQRVQDISHDDAVAEGFSYVEPCAEYPHGKTWGRLGFSQTWDKINLERGYGWEANPWVWVVEFKKIG